MSVDAVSTMQARIAQITSLVTPDRAVATDDASTGASATTDFAAEYESALGAFSGPGSGRASSSLSSNLSAMLGGGSFTTGVTASSSSLLGMFSNAVASAGSAANAASAHAIEALGGVADKVSSSAKATGHDLVEAAREYLGVKYVWGGESLAEGGLDCSGLVLRSFADLGIDGIPRVARDQGKIGTEVSSMDDAKTGDLLIFDGGSHIGIYIGDGKMIDAPYRGSYVQERDVYETPTSIRRVL